MKKLILILLSLIPILSLHAQDSTKVVNHVKYIVAYHLNCLSLEDNKDIVKRFKDLGTGDNRAMADLKAVLDNTNFTKNRDLCNQIDRLSVPAKSIEELKTYFKEDFFKITEGEIRDFLKKRNKDKAKMDNLKREIANAIDEYLADKNYPVTNSEEVIDLSDKSKGSKDIKKDESNREINKETGENNLLPTILACISVVLCVVLLGLGYICLRLRKEKNDLEIDLLNRKDEIDRLVKEKEYIYKEADKIRRINDKLENDNSRLRKQLEENDKAKIIVSAQTQSTTSANPVVIEKKPEPVAKISYVGVPKNGAFTGEFDSYKPGKCLYKVISTDGLYGTFEFYNSTESIGIVKQSRTEFLEPACNITNLDDTTFNKIETLKEGKVEKVNNVWRIVEKSDIKLI